jgi:SAM-dependent MidA family methyltransferase
MPVDPQNLPAPSADALAHSQRLVDQIKAEMAANNGLIPFNRFMDLCLYAPGLGYYSAGLSKFGEDGDFVTAPEISPLFSRCLARQCAEVGGDILEFGAGRGVMAADILLELKEQGCLPDHYFILELSADLKQRQQAMIQDKAPDLFERVVWLEQLPDSFSGMVLANEVLDAMPVHVFNIKDDKIGEQYVALEGDQFVWQTGDASSDELHAQVKQIKTEQELPQGYVSEINLSLTGWINSIAGIMKKGAVLLIDYGYPCHEYYHPQRSSGTLMCHYQHRAHDNPLVWPGLQDITAHVDFTAVAEASVDAGLSVDGFVTQAHFLMNAGIEQLMASCLQDPVEMNQQIKRLILPDAMGEMFKVMCLSKETDVSLSGFAQFDMRGRL